MSGHTIVENIPESNNYTLKLEDNNLVECWKVMYNGKESIEYYSDRDFNGREPILSTHDYMTIRDYENQGRG